MIESVRYRAALLPPMSEAIGAIRDRLAGFPGAYTTIYRDRLSFFKATRQVYEEAASSNREIDKTFRWGRLGGHWGEPNLELAEQTEFANLLRSTNNLLSKGWALHQLLAVGDRTALRQARKRVIDDTIKARGNQTSDIEIKLIKNPTSKYSISPFITDQEVILAIYQQHDTFARSGLILRGRDVATMFTQYFENLWGLEPPDGVVSVYNSRIREEIVGKMKATNKHWSTCVNEHLGEIFQQIEQRWFPSDYLPGLKN